jgi:hypothetical protein
MRRSGATEWKASLGPVPPMPPEIESSLVLSANQEWIAAQGLWLLFAAFILGFSAWVPSLSSRDMLIAAPVVLPYAVLAGIAGYALWRGGSSKGHLPRWAGRAARLAAVAVILASATYTIAVLRARASAAPGPVIRAQVIEVDHSRRGPVRAALALQDGSIVETYDYPGRQYGSESRCLAVRRVSAGRFSWLRMVDASPLPGSGQLAWPIARADCFSAAALSSLTGAPR